MRDLKLRGKPFFTGLMAVLVSPTPIRILCIFSTYRVMRSQFSECADQALKLDQGFVVRMSEYTITTPVGSKVIFSAIETSRGVERFMGLELHDLWIEDGHPFESELWHILKCTVRL